MSGTLTAAQEEGVREGAVRVFLCVCVVVCMPTCVHTDEGEGGGITVDILIGRRCQMPAFKAGQASPGCNSVSAARQGFRQGFRSPLAPLSAPTGIRCSSVVRPPLSSLTHTHINTLLLLAPSFLRSTLRHCQHQSI